MVGKRVTDFLDLNEVIQRPPEIGFRARGGSASGKRILVAEASAFSRGLIRSGLDMAGYQVVEAANLDEAIRGLEQQPVDVVVAALDLPPDGSSALLRRHAPAAGVASDSGAGLGRFGRADSGVQPAGRRDFRIARRSSTGRPCSNRWRGWPRRWLPPRRAPVLRGRGEITDGDAIPQP